MIYCAFINGSNYEIKFFIRNADHSRFQNKLNFINIERIKTRATFQAYKSLFALQLTRK